MNIDLTKLIKNHGGEWVALDQKAGRVVATGKNAKVAFTNAKKKGIQIPNLFKVPSKLTAYIG